MQGGLGHGDPTSLLVLTQLLIILLYSLYIQIIAVSVIILVQGWSSIFPTFSAVDFFSFYIELPVMLVMSLGWLFAHKFYRGPTKRISPAQPLSASTHPNYRSISDDHSSTPISAPLPQAISPDSQNLGLFARLRNVTDIVDTKTVDLHVDEYHEDTDDQLDDETRAKRLAGRAGPFWRLYYLLA